MQHMNWYMRPVASQSLCDFTGRSYTAFQKNRGRPPHDATLHWLFVPLAVNLPKENRPQLFFSEP